MNAHAYHMLSPHIYVITTKRKKNTKSELRLMDSATISDEVTVDYSKINIILN